MGSATIILLVSLILIAWRLAFAVLRRSPVIEIAPKQKRKWATAFIAARPFEHGRRDEGSHDPGDRAKNYLRRVVALTNATGVGDGYMLDVGTTRFHVRHRYAKRLRGETDSKCRHEQTCFYSKQVMPEEEQVATVLLQLKNNPALFDKWTTWNGAFKADGEMFKREE